MLPKGWSTALYFAVESVCSRFEKNARLEKVYSKLLV